MAEESSPTLTILCVTKAEPYATPFLQAMARLAAACLAECVIAADGPEAAARLAALDLELGTHRRQVQSRGFLESVLEEALAYCTGDYVLRLDDDERCSPAMVEWLAAGSWRKGRRWSFPTAHLWTPTEFITNKPLWPNTHPRLTLREEAGGRAERPHAPSPGGAGALAPVALEHHKFLVKSQAERQALADHYEALKPGAGRGRFLAYSLPELAFKTLVLAPLGDGQVRALDKATLRSVPVQGQRPLASVPPPPAAVRDTPALPALVLDDKNLAELAFWEQAAQGGDLRASHGHYAHFYTAHFGLDAAFYQGKRVLDIGCGPAGSLEWATMAAERVGLDPLADEYRARLGAAAHGMRYVAGRSEAIPFPDGHFDVVCAFNSLDHVDDLAATVAEIARVTAPGGLFLLLAETHPRPTRKEPIVFGWDVVQRFASAFTVADEQHLEKHRRGLYQSLRAEMGQVVPFNHRDPSPRHGVLSAKFIRSVNS